MITLKDIFGKDVKDLKPDICTRIGLVEGVPFVRRCQRIKSPGRDLCKQHITAKFKEKG